jgi:hypothetical protein
MSGDRLDNVIGFAGLEQPRYDHVPQGVEPEPRQISRITQHAPGSVPLAQSRAAPFSGILRLLVSFLLSAT